MFVPLQSCESAAHAMNMRRESITSRTSTGIVHTGNVFLQRRVLCAHAAVLPLQPAEFALVHQWRALTADSRSLHSGAACT